MTTQAKRPQRLVEALQDRYDGNIYLTGYSLGGGLASLVIVVNDELGGAVKFKLSCSFCVCAADSIETRPRELQWLHRSGIAKAELYEMTRVLGRHRCGL